MESLVTVGDRPRQEERVGDATKSNAAGSIAVNRAPVLTLWAAVVAERLGHDPETALTLGKAVAGLTAQAKGRMVGLYHQKVGPGGEAPRKSGLGEDQWIPLCGRSVPALRTRGGVRAVVKDVPIDPESVRTYLQKAFGAELETVSEAMRALAASVPVEHLAEIAFGLYEKFRPAIPPGQAGWGRKGELKLAVIRRLASGAPQGRGS